MLGLEISTHSLGTFSQNPHLGPLTPDCGLPKPVIINWLRTTPRAVAPTDGCTRTHLLLSRGRPASWQNVRRGPVGRDWENDDAMQAKRAGFFFNFGGESRTKNKYSPLARSPWPDCRHHYFCLSVHPSVRRGEWMDAIFSEITTTREGRWTIGL